MVLLKPKLHGRTISSSSNTHDWAADRGDVKSDDVNIASTLSLHPSAGSKQSTGSQGMRVLLVEDNEINLKLLVAYMRKLKLDHATACNGLEALNAYKDAQGSFDVIFMGLFGLTLLQTRSLTNVTDISMPVMSGIESTRHIRRFENEAGLHPVALIALTGAANPTTRQEAFSSGVDLFLTKPVPMKSLKVMLDDLKANGRKSLSA
jgi:CheY-like chemotaxis protein